MSPLGHNLSCPRQISSSSASRPRRIVTDVSKRKAKSTATPDLELLMKEAREELVEHGLLKLVSIKPTAARDAVVAKLVKQGFELTKTSLRVPLGNQLRSAVAHGRAITVLELPAHMHGATKPEIKAALERAVRDGVVHRVLRGTAESVVAADMGVLSLDDVARLSTCLGSLSKTLAKAQKSGGLTLLSSDVREALEKAQQVLPVTQKKKPPTTVDRVLQTVDSVRDSKTGLSFIPKVITQLSKTMDTATATRALLQAAEQDLLELRPEGGLARLSQAELTLCPPGPQGTRLSWARRLSGGTT
jgi:hypothetical protein